MKPNTLELKDFFSVEIWNSLHGVHNSSCCYVCILSFATCCDHIEIQERECLSNECWKIFDSCLATVWVERIVLNKKQIKKLTLIGNEIQSLSENEITKQVNNARKLFKKLKSWCILKCFLLWRKGVENMKNKLKKNKEINSQTPLMK